MVRNVRVSGVTLSKTSYTMTEIDETVRLIATITPSNATNKKVTWSSDNPYYASVSSNGVVTANVSGGSAIITAKTDDGGYEASCTVYVDTRPKVHIRKDSHSFYVEFDNGKIWKHIGLDISKRNEYYTSLTPPTMDAFHYSSLIPEEQRYLDNLNNLVNLETIYESNEMAYLYLFDPLGIEYYMRTNAHEGRNISSGEYLIFKDQVYESIFGTSERESGRFFFVIIDGRPQYGRYDDSDRNNIFSNAEVLFGYHTNITWDLSKFLKTFLEGLFEWTIEDSPLGTAVDVYKTLFHAGGILGACSDKAKSYVDDYISDGMSDQIKENLIQKYGTAFAEKVVSTFNWAVTLTYITAHSVLSAFDIPNPNDVTIYENVYRQPNFSTIIDGLDGNIYIKDIIDKVYQN